MTEHSHHPEPQDICLLLRAHGEQLWLNSEVLPVVRQLELPDAIPDDQLGAALAYLEVLWLEASRRAAETDATHERLGPVHEDGNQVLQERARRYHAAVRRLRSDVSTRVYALTRSWDETSAHEHANS
jgi:hypothetical protein